MLHTAAPLASFKEKTLHIILTMSMLMDDSDMAETGI